MRKGGCFFQKLSAAKVAVRTSVWEDAQRMSTQTDGRNPLADESRDVPSVRAAVIEYRRLLNRLASRARLLGSHHPEDAAQEALKRSLENPLSQPAIDYYFSEHPPAGFKTPQWSLDQLFAWLHGVLHYVVLEEHNRTSARREVSAAWNTAESDSGHPHPVDPMPDQLDVLIQQERENIVEDCFPALEHKYRSVLKMRADGLK